MDSIHRTRTNPSEQLTTQLKQMSYMRGGGGKPPQPPVWPCLSHGRGFQNFKSQQYLVGHVTRIEKKPVKTQTV